MVIVKVKSHLNQRSPEGWLQVPTPFHICFVSTSRGLEEKREPAVDLSYMRSSSFPLSIASAVKVSTSGKTASDEEGSITAAMLSSGSSAVQYANSLVI